MKLISRFFPASSLALDLSPCHKANTDIQSIFPPNVLQSWKLSTDNRKSYRGFLLIFPASRKFINPFLLFPTIQLIRFNIPVGCSSTIKTRFNHFLYVALHVILGQHLDLRCLTLFGTLTTL